MGNPSMAGSGFSWIPDMAAPLPGLAAGSPAARWLEELRARGAALAAKAAGSGAWAGSGSGAPEGGERAWASLADEVFAMMGSQSNALEAHVCLSYGLNAAKFLAQSLPTEAYGKGALPEGWRLAVGLSIWSLPDSMAGMAAVQFAQSAIKADEGRKWGAARAARLACCQLLGKGEWFTGAKRSAMLGAMDGRGREGLAARFEADKGRMGSPEMPEPDRLLGTLKGESAAEGAWLLSFAMPMLSPPGSIASAFAMQHPIVPYDHTEMLAHWPHGVFDGLSLFVPAPPLARFQGVKGGMAALAAFGAGLAEQAAGAAAGPLARAEPSEVERRMASWGLGGAAKRLYGGRLFEEAKAKGIGSGDLAEAFAGRLLAMCRQGRSEIEFAAKRALPADAGLAAAEAAAAIRSWRSGSEASLAAFGELARIAAAAAGEPAPPPAFGARAPKP